MHKHNEEGNSWMMWIMMICCMAPVLLLFTSGGAFATLNWPVLGAVAVLLALHWYVMKKMHGHSSKGEAGKDDKDGGHSCH